MHRIAILTISDRVSRGEAVDRSGEALVELVTSSGLGEVIARDLVSDDIAQIKRCVERWCGRGGSGGSGESGGGQTFADLILTTGGTGLAPRDVTPEAITPILDKPAPNLMELARSRCLETTPLAYLSRGVSGVIGRTLVIALPGSPAGAVEQLSAILDILPHAIDIATGKSDQHPPR